MPELPEVETTRRGIYPHLLLQTVNELIVRNRGLRIPVAADLAEHCMGKTIIEVSRRAKYLLLHFNDGCLLIHLGMTGHLRLLPTGSTPPKKHDHIDLNLANKLTLRYNDPRRFGLWLFTSQPSNHPLISHLGPEPLSDAFTGNWLYNKSRQRKQAIKTLIMDNRIVVGVGNIYATESLYLAKINPLIAAGLLTKQECELLAFHIKQVLTRAIEAGGTTLRDFLDSEGKPGYFAHNLQVYGRKGQACFQCQTAIEVVQIGQRSTAFCPNCQSYRK